MQYKFNKHLQNLLPDRPLKILVAVSGGADSMCLLNLLFNTDLDVEIAIAHMNFNLRGVESDADERLVREWALAHNTEIFVKSVDTVQYAKLNSLSIEMAARELRYEWFYSLKKEYGFDYIALAHHANDNAETLLLNLVRGSGISGICGMKALDETRSLLRPLLSYTREEIEGYMQKKGIVYRTDSTNADTKFHRNRIRGVVIPELKHLNQSVVETLNRNMTYFSQASDILDELLVTKREELVCIGGNGNYPFLNGIKNRRVQKYISLKYSNILEFSISVEKLLNQNHCSYWLYAILSGYGFNSAQVDDMVGALSAAAPKKMLSKEFLAIKERGYIKVYRLGGILDDVEDRVEIEEFDGVKEVNISGSRILLEICNRPISQPELDEGILAVSADKLTFPLVLRGPEVGDRWRPFGMKAGKTLSDYFTDIKMDSILKKSVPVLCCAAKKNSPDNIICLPGLEISDYYKVSGSDKRVLRITLLD